MAKSNQAVAENVPGDFFVDHTCIDCDTCRQLAPETFGEAADYSFVRHQPSNESERRRALQALLACPTSSIGARQSKAQSALADFPLPIENEVSYCGFNSKDSFGANSYFVQNPAGNWLIDSPRFLPALVKRFEEAGGVAKIFLSHRDDVADSDKYAQRFGAQRIIHQRDASAVQDAEIKIGGDEPVELGSDFLFIPTPGHTRGHAVLLYKNRYLFTGDHLAYSRRRRSLTAFRGACWYSWEEQTRSMEKLLDYDFEWILTGHGERIHLPLGEMKREMKKLVEWMKKA